MKARIYRPSQTAMQSGMGKTSQWVLEYVSHADRRPEPLMGWTQSSDTLEEVRMRFDSLEKARSFADDQGMEYTVSTAHTKVIKPRNYGDNFRYRATDS